MPHPSFHLILHLTLLTCLGGLATCPCLAQERLRVLVETDLGGDADDQASLVRFLLYSNEWDVEGIIADRHEKAMHKDPVRNYLGLKVKDGWELAQAYLKAYREVYPNLVKHKPDYPSYDHLRARTVPGHTETEEGVRLIIAAAARDDPRPLWYGNWGSNSGAVSRLTSGTSFVLISSHAAFRWSSSESTSACSQKKTPRTKLSEKRNRSRSRAGLGIVVH